MRFTAITNTTVLIEPPKLKAAERTILVALDTENILGIEQLSYVRLVFDLDLLHRSEMTVSLLSSRRFFQTDVISFQI